jgi:hypothetical protein
MPYIDCDRRGSRLHKAQFARQARVLLYPVYELFELFAFEQSKYICKRMKFHLVGNAVHFKYPCRNIGLIVDSPDRLARRRNNTAAEYVNPVITDLRPFCRSRAADAQLNPYPAAEK